MTWHLTFEHLHLYDAGDTGVTLAVILRLASLDVHVTAKLDTGSSHCIFERIYADALGLEVQSGYAMRVGTAAGSFMTYGHNVTLQVKGYEFELMAFFAEDYIINRNVLGRNGFLNRVQLGLLDYEGKLLLSRQEDAPSL
jgi:predicted aspartyl protease